MSILRLAVFLLFPLLLSPGVGAEGEAPRLSIVLIGDLSLNGPELARPAERLPARLEAALRAEGHSVEVRGIGVRETSKAGLICLMQSKLGRDVLLNPAGKAVVIGLGRNDCGRFALWQTRSHLDLMLTLLAERHVPVLLVGTQAYEYCGEAYAAAFPGIFAELAARDRAIAYVDAEAPPSIVWRREARRLGVEPVSLDALLPLVRQLLARASRE